MIEQFKTWIVESTLEVREIESFCDNESRKVLFYRYVNGEENEIFSPQEKERFFNSEEDARTFVANRLDYLKEMSESVFDIIDEIKWIKDDVCTFDRTEFLNRLNGFRSQRDFYECLCKQKSAINNLFKLYIRTGMLNVNAFTFRKDEVKRVKWYNDGHAQLILNEGKSIMTRTDAESELVCAVFGENISGMEFTVSFDKDGVVIKKQ